MEVWEGEIGKAIQKRMKETAAPAKDKQFGLRVLDVYLMARGGRWNNLLGQMQ